jgi:hypothetical protein
MLFRQMCGKGCFIQRVGEHGNGHEICHQTSEKSPLKIFMKICRVGSESLHKDRWTDMTKLIVFSGNFVNAPDDTSFVTVGSRTDNDNDQWGNGNSK